MSVSTPPRYYGADWLVAERGADAKPLSALGRCVADILGAVYGGLYHVDSNAIRKAGWDHAAVVCVTVRHEVATVDSSDLWTLAVLTQACGIRLAIKGIGPHYLRLQFTAGPHMWMGTVHPPHEMVTRVLERFAYVVDAHVPTVAP